MYIIINKTQGTTVHYSGTWPDFDEVLDRGDKIIVISTYTDTIKVPYKQELNGVTEWHWEDFPKTQKI